MSTQPLIGNWPIDSHALRPVGVRYVTLEGFLGERVAANPASLLAGLNSPIVHAFEQLAAGTIPDDRRGSRLSDLYKWIEGCAATLLDPAHEHHEELGVALCRIADLVERANESMFRLELKEVHNLYIAGHFFQAAVMHARATGSQRLVEQAGAWARRLQIAFDQGNPAFEEMHEQAHPCVELGLILLARVCGKPELRDFARRLVERFDVAEGVADLACGRHRRHAVCVEYLLSAVAELQLEEREAATLQRLIHLWEELVQTRLYVAGGIGYDEIIPAAPFDLPHILEGNPRKDVAETCASIGLAMLTWRIHALVGESRFYDVIERTLYNHLLGGLSLDHQAVYYYNPLQLTGDFPHKSDLGQPLASRTRLPVVHRTSCCITNAWRFIPTLSEYVYSADDEGLYINLFTSGRLSYITKDGVQTRITVDTEYPHDGRVSLTVQCDRDASFVLRVRIPDWCDAAALTLPDGAVHRPQAGRYFEISRTWSTGDEVTLDLPMSVKVLAGDPRIQATAGCGVVTRGPLIYCLEAEDVDEPLPHFQLACGTGVSTAARSLWCGDLLGGVNVVEVPVHIRESPFQRGTAPYYVPSSQCRTARVRMIPYYARGNRRQPTGWVTWIPFAKGGGE